MQPSWLGKLEMTMENAKNPIQALLDWLDAQPARIRGDLIGLTGFPLMEIMADFPNDTWEATSNSFQAWLLRCEGLSPASVVAKAITVRGNFGFIFSQRVGTASWVNARDNTERLLARARNENNASMVEFGEEHLISLPGREAEWLKAATSWYTLCEGTLSDAAIGQWFSDALMQATSATSSARPSSMG